LPQAGFEPPPSLQQQIFLWLESWEQRVQLQKKGKGWAEGGLDQEDMALEGFIKLMKYLGVVLLQDMAVLQPGKYSFQLILLYS
jgi:hypothetical protein